LRLGDRVVLSSAPGGVGDTVVVSALVRRRADPSEVARAEYRIRMHLDELQTLIGYGDRVDRFAVGTTTPAAADSAIRLINAAAFGFQGFRSRDIAVQTSRTFAVVSRFHRAIGVITIVASAIFLLCIMLLKVEERRLDAAVMRMIGISATTIVRAFVLESTLVAGVGSVAGIGLAAIAGAATNLIYQRRFETTLVFSYLTSDIIVQGVGLSLVLGIAVGALAAIRLVGAQPLSLWRRAG
jgi:putative ABC transport system permease protein